MSSLWKNISRLRVLASKRGLGADHTQTHTERSRPSVPDVRRNPSTKTRDHIVLDGHGGRCVTIEPIYEVGNMMPVGYISDAVVRRTTPFEDDELVFAHDRKVYPVAPVSEVETVTALEGMLGILEDTDE